MATKRQLLVRHITNLVLLLSLSLNLALVFQITSRYSPDGFKFMGWREWTSLAVQIILFFTICCPLYALFLMNGSHKSGPKPIGYRWKRALPILFLALLILGIAISVIVSPRIWATGTYCNKSHGCRYVSGGPVAIYSAWAWVTVVAALSTMGEVGYTFYRSTHDYPKHGGEDEEYKIRTVEPAQRRGPASDTRKSNPPLPPAPQRQIRQQKEEEMEVIYSPGSLQLQRGQEIESLYTRQQQQQRQPDRPATTYTQYPPRRQALLTAS
ncbi:hypothetical protein CPC16_011111 [Podila verticillata]|nr:hypothetical protein BGZ59_000246 [Podila verticillata]KAF9394501.1 hypothetical protein CPC16_011111 [Podila verticillata]KFH71648.1 hypothetical protein MVEG_01944 [Podila verticillata NRRL 6337]